MKFELEDLVERLGSPTDYTVGRQGRIMDISGDRCRVNWTHGPTYDFSKEIVSINRFGKYVRHERDGFVFPMRAVRTWVKMEFLRKIESYSLKS